jgi:hypothetical protein
MTLPNAGENFLIYAHLNFSQSCTCEPARLNFQTHAKLAMMHKGESLTMITTNSNRATLHSPFQTIMYGLAMANAPNEFTGRPYGDDDDESEFALASNNTRSLNDANTAIRSDNKAGQLEALWIMQQYLQSSSSSSGFRNRSPSKSFQLPSTNMAVAIAPEWPPQAHPTDHTVFATSEVIKQKLFSEKEDDDDRLLNQILFASDDQTISSIPVVSKTKANPNSDLAYGKEITAYISRPNSDRLHHQYGNPSSGNASSHPEVVDNTVFNSMVWHPTYQPNHQEVNYNESIFETETATTAGIQPLEVHPHRSSVAPRTVGQYGSWTESSEGNGSFHGPNEKAHVALQSSTSGTDALLYAAKLAGVTPQEVAQVVDPAQKKATSKGKPKSKKRSKGLHERDDEVGNITGANSASTEQDSFTGISVSFIPHHEISENDVLLGRGGRTNHHVGNKYYLECKAQLQEQYLRADKDEKTSLSQQLVQMIHDRNGRFLKLADPELLEKAHRDAATYGDCLLWYEVSLAVARRKASQTLRELNTPELRAAKRAKYAK